MAPATHAARFRHDAPVNDLDEGCSMIGIGKAVGSGQRLETTFCVSQLVHNCSSPAATWALQVRSFLSDCIQ